MVFTRLINLDTFELEQFEIGKMPLYVAASHVWLENLFPVSETHSISSTTGMRLVTTALRSYPPDEIVPGYCWVDTWCINQSSNEDKRHQLPQMGDVYRDAQCVIIVVAHSFTFTQADWDSAIEACREILDIQRLKFAARAAHPRVWGCLTELSAKGLLQACMMSLEIATLPWASRIWTAQEYILSRSSIWIGNDSKPLRLHYRDIRDVLGSRKTRTYHQLMHRYGKLVDVPLEYSESEEAVLGSWHQMTKIKESTHDRIGLISLVGTRSSTIPEDAIYGLMGASGVEITPEAGESLETAWIRWWEASLKTGNLHYALMPVLESNQAELRTESWNCIMPPCERRCEYGTKLMKFNTTKSWAECVVTDGTLSVVGRNAGTCLVEKFFFSPKFPKGIESMSRFCGGDEDMMRRLCLAASLNQLSRAEVDDTVKATCASYRLRNDPESLTEAEKEEVGGRTGKFKFFILFKCYTNVYLGQITNSVTTTSVLIVTGEEIPETGKLLALDIEKDNRDPHSEKTLMIVRVPEDPTLPMHKVGMTYPMSLHKTDCRLDECTYYAHKHSEPLQRYRIGGSACEYCNERRKRLEA